MTEDKSLEIRALALVLGGALGVAGMTTGPNWLVYVGLGVALIGGVLAIWRRRKRD